MLLLHGTGDDSLSDYCAKRLYQMYGSARGERILKLFDGDNHGLTRNSLKAEQLIFDFVSKNLGRRVEDGEEALKAENMVGDKEDRVKLMKAGNDLEKESL